MRGIGKRCTRREELYGLREAEPQQIRAKREPCACDEKMARATARQSDVARYVLEAHRLVEPRGRPGRHLPHARLWTLVTLAVRNELSEQVAAEHEQRWPSGVESFEIGEQARAELG